MQDVGGVNVVPHDRRPTRFVLEASALLALLSMAVVGLAHFGSESSTATRALLAVAVVMIVRSLANTISVPMVDRSSFTIRAGMGRTQLGTDPRLIDRRAMSGRREKCWSTHPGQ